MVEQQPLISSREKFIRMWRNRKTPDVARSVYIKIFIKYTSQFNTYDIQCRIAGSTPAILTKMQVSYSWSITLPCQGRYAGSNPTTCSNTIIK